MRHPTMIALFAGLVTLAIPITDTLAQATKAPEAATGRAVKPLGTAKRFMIAAANPLAADAGRQILVAGGSAVDAMIATQLVLGLVEPQSSGLGGGAFLLHWDDKTKAVTSLDGRETAPMAATPVLFMRPDGKPMEFYEAVIGGRSVGVPGVPRLLGEAHKRWGTLPWAKLFAPAIRLADEGFAMSPRLAGLIAQEKDLALDPAAKAYFYNADGTPKTVGTILKNPAYAQTLRLLAEGGADAFYSGAIAEAVLTKVTTHPTNPGGMTASDLAGYRVIERQAVCGAYGTWRVCGMGPPSSGGIAVLQILGMLGGRDMAALGPGPEAVHLFTEAGRLAFADRAAYVADPAFAAVPTEGLIDPAYVAARAGLIDPTKSMGKATAGDPPRKQGLRLAPSDGFEHGTSHIAIIDASGNAVSMTSSIEDAFGARQMTSAGFLLNNQLTDFSFTPEADGKPVANRVEPGKRPRSSMAPTFVFDEAGRLVLIAGSPGGSSIINYVARALIATLDWKMDPQQAVDAANFGSRNGPTELEAGTEAEAWKAALEAKGHTVKLTAMTSGIQMIRINPTGIEGGADGRREGVAIGD
ncbi:MAG: gamma-glutamyltransferase [Labrys sp. (in: a-proteobacteria)]